jgi:ADP-ribose pyrophosphatase YjhB (NUDIX family)
MKARSEVLGISSLSPVSTFKTRPGRVLFVVGGLIVLAETLRRRLRDVLAPGGNVRKVFVGLWDLSYRSPVQISRTVRRRIQALSTYSFTVGAVAVIRPLGDEHSYLLAHHRYPTGDPGEEWALPGGGIHEYENIPKALEREIHRELGITVAVGDLLFVDKSDPPRLDFVFEAAVTGGSFAPSHEVSNYAFRRISELNSDTQKRHMQLLERVERNEGVCADNRIFVDLPLDNAGNCAYR